MYFIPKEISILRSPKETIVSFSSFMDFKIIAPPLVVMLLSEMSTTVKILFILKQSAKLSAKTSHNTFLERFKLQRVMFYLKADIMIAPLIEFIALLLKLS